MRIYQTCPARVGSLLLLFAASMPAATVTLTSLVGDKDHLGPRSSYNEHSPSQIDVGDPAGFDYGYHIGGDFSWIHSVDVSGLIVQSVQLDVTLLGFLLGPVQQKLYLNGTELPDAFNQSVPVATITGPIDTLQTFSFSLDPSYLQSGSLAVRVWVSTTEGWGGVDWSELTVVANDSPEPSTLALVIAGLAMAVGLGRRRRSARP